MNRMQIFFHQKFYHLLKSGVMSSVCKALPKSITGKCAVILSAIIKSFTVYYIKELYILTEMETFAKEPELTTILRRLNLTLVLRNKIRFAGFCHMFVTASLLCLGALLRDHLQMGAFS